MDTDKLRERSVEETRESHKEALRDYNAVLQKTAGWLLAANAGGLLLCLNAALDRKVCHWEQLQLVAWLLAGGLVVSFIVPLFYSGWRLNHLSTSKGVMQEYLAVLRDNRTLYEKIGPGGALSETDKKTQLEIGKRLFDLAPRMMVMFGKMKMGQFAVAFLFVLSSGLFVGAVSVVLLSAEALTLPCVTPNR